MDKLKATVKNLHVRTGQFSLYIHMICKNGQPDRGRLKNEIEDIKQIVLTLETEIDEI